LFSATLDNDVLLVKLSLEHGADLEMWNLEGRNLLHQAIVQLSGDLIRLFLAHGADPNTEVTSAHLEGGTALHLVITEGHVDTVESLLRYSADRMARTHAHFPGAPVTQPFPLTCQNTRMHVIDNM
jgi:ankyrin repeat protein